MCDLFRVSSCFMRRRYAWMRCLFFLVMRGGELRFMAGFGKGRDKLGGDEMRWHWTSGMS